MSQGPATFEDLALRHGIVSAEQLEECRVLRNRVAELGLECDLEEVLVKKGFVSKVQAMALHAALGRGNRHAIEGYELLGKLGRGGMGTVYKARQLSMDRIVALKVLAPKLRKEKNEVDRFVREAKVIAQLNHPNIVTGIDAGHSNGIHYFAMEFVDGEALSQRIAREGARPWKEALAITRQIGTALDHAHRNGLVHRDVKPANIIMGKDGSVKLTDLGMARFAERHDLKVTQSGQVVGTPLYMSPEQARGEPVDIRSDLYSLGITLYEMLAGAPPFTAKDPLVVLHKHLYDQVKFGLPNVPGDVQTVGHRLTEKDRVKRYGSPAEMLRDVEILEKGGSLPQSRSTLRRSVRQQRVSTLRKTKRQGRLILAGTIAGFAVLAVGLALAVSSASTPPPPVVHIPPPPPRTSAPLPAARPPEEPEPLTERDRSVLVAYRAVRAYERNNPGDLEEIALQYADLLPKSAGTLYEDRVRARDEEAKRFLAAAMEIQMNEIGAELKRRVSRRDYAGGLDLLDRRAAEFRGAPWNAWVADQRKFVDTEAAKQAEGYRRASALAESKKDFTGAIWAMEQVRALGLPALTREAETRIEALVAGREKIRLKEEAARKRKAERERADARALAAFLDRAERLATERKYEEIETKRPALTGSKVRNELERNLTVFRAAHEVLAEARQYAIGRMGMSIAFDMRDGERVSGLVEAVQASVLLVNGRTFDVNQMTTASAVALYRAARAGTARPEAIFAFALYEKDLDLAEGTLRRSDLILPSRTTQFLGALRKDVEAKARRARREKEAADLLTAAETAVLSEQPERYAEILQKYSETGAGKAAREMLKAIAPEIVVHAADLPESAYAGQMQQRNSADSPGGAMAAMPGGQDVYGPPPSNSNFVTLRVQVLGGVPYRCWVRLRTGAPNSGNGSNALYLQFSDALGKDGKPAFRLGSGNALTVRGGPQEGWRWIGRDRTRSSSKEPVLRFPKSGRITVRIYGGNDNAGFDQFVLSPTKYISGPPGSAVVAKP